MFGRDRITDGAYGTFMVPRARLQHRTGLAGWPGAQVGERDGQFGWPAKADSKQGLCGLPGQEGRRRGRRDRQGVVQGPIHVVASAECDMELRNNTAL